jgi:uncharacterized membrane protein
MSEESNLPTNTPGEINIPRQGKRPGNISSVSESIEYSRAAFSGPLPPPELLGHYEKLCPGSSDRIIRLAEEEALHRRSIEQSIARTEIEQAKRDSDESGRGQICALLITLAAIGAGAYTALAGHEIAGSIIGVGGIGSIVTTFLAGRSQREAPPPPPPPQQAPRQPKKKGR